MSNRKRINLSVPEQLFSDIEDTARRGGFKGVCPFLVSLATAFLRYASRSMEEAAKPQTIEKEIEEIFSRLEYGEIEIKKNNQNNQQRITRI